MIKRLFFSRSFLLDNNVNNFKNGNSSMSQVIRYAHSLNCKYFDRQQNLIYSTMIPYNGSSISQILTGMRFFRTENFSWDDHLASTTQKREIVNDVFEFNE